MENKKDISSLGLNVTMVFKQSPSASDEDFVPSHNKDIKEVVLTTPQGHIFARIRVGEDGKLKYEYHKNAEKILGYKPWK